MTRLCSLGHFGLDPVDSADADRQDWSDLIVTAPPLYIQEKVHPKAIIDDLVRQSEIAREWSPIPATLCSM